MSKTKTAKATARAAAKRAVTARYKKLSKLMADRTPPEKVARFLYWPDVIVTGEGFDRVYRGLDELMPMFVDFLSVHLSPHCAWTLTDPIFSSDSLAACFSQFTCHFDDGRPDMNVRTLYVWEKREDDWKVVLEQVSNGLMR